MEGKSRLTGLEHIGEITDALFACLKLLQNAQPSFIGEGVEDKGRLLDVFTPQRDHGDIIHQHFFMRQATAVSTRKRYLHSTRTRMSGLLQLTITRSRITWPSGSCRIRRAPFAQSTKPLCT